MPSRKCLRNFSQSLGCSDSVSSLKVHANFLGMSSIAILASVAWSYGVSAILFAAIDFDKHPFSLSPLHDSGVITACVASFILAFSSPLSVVAKRDTVADIMKTTAQMFVWGLTLVSLFWAGRIAMELLLRAGWKFKES